MYQVAVMGDYDSIYGFSALGVDIFPLDDKVLAIKELRRLADNEYAIIYITESLAAEISEEIDRYRERVTPAIILIPGVLGNTGEGVLGVKKSVEQAIGSDIVFGNN